jgi:DNA-3-methyladenine glycosylase
MFGPAGHAYVYLSYGMHYCMNAVTSDVGKADAVLIRAVEPLEGWELMSRRRGLPDVEIDRLSAAASEPRVREHWGRTLTGGPGKLCQAFGMTLADDGVDLTLGKGLWITSAIESVHQEIYASPRIGIRHSVDLLQRFTLRGDPYVSRIERPN